MRMRIWGRLGPPPRASPLRKAGLALIVLGAILAMCGCAARSVSPAATDPKLATRGVLELFTRFGFGHGCPITTPQGQYILTAAHMIDPSPLDKDAPLIWARWSDAEGNEGRAKPVAVEVSADLGVLAFIGDVRPAHLYELAKTKPVAGETLWTVGYDMSSQAQALSRRPVAIQFIRTVAGHLVARDSARRGSSGSCVVDAQRFVQAVDSWGFQTGKDWPYLRDVQLGKGEVSVGPIVCCGWLESVITDHQ